MKIKDVNFGLLFLCLHIISCTTKEKKPTENIGKPIEVIAPIVEAGRIYDRITKSNSSYSVYFPKNYNEKEKYPAIIFLDPHGHGKFPLEKYESLADKFRFLLIGSNDSKNGMNIEQCIKFAGDLLNETSTNLPGFKHQISLAGFSGGAKVALVAANTISGFNSGIYCGAAFPAGSIQINIPLLAIAGRHDMNYTEVRNFNQSIDKSSMSHALVEWNGKHEWPDTSIFEHAFYWNLFTSMRNKIIDKNDSIIGAYKKKMEGAIIHEKNVLERALFIQEEIEMLKEIYPINDYQNKLISILNSTQFKQAKKNQELILAYEDQQKMEFANAFENREILWWNNQIQKLNEDKNNESNQRLLGYISLAAWSYSSKSVAINNAAFALKALQIYKLADPENPEQAFITACLYSKNGKQDSAIYFLKEAVTLGFDDRSKIENEKDLFPLHGRGDFLEVIGKMR